MRRSRLDPCCSNALFDRVQTLKNCEPTTPSAQMIAPLIKAHGNIRNRPGTPWSFGAIDGQPVPPEFIEVFAVPDHVSEVVLGSDGWPELRPTLAQSEEVLACVLRDDPLIMRVSPATKGVAPGAISLSDRRAFSRSRTPASRRSTTNCNAASSYVARVERTIRSRRSAPGRTIR